MRIGTRLTAVTVASSLVALALYGVWSVTIRRDQFLRELAFEEQNLSTILQGALEFALEHRDVTQAREVVEKFTTAERLFGLAVHGLPGNGVARTSSIEPYLGQVPDEVVDRVRATGVEEQLRFDVDGKRFLVHLLPLTPISAEPRGVAEIWRDLSYIDGYLRATALRLLMLALVIGAVLAGAIAFVTQRSISRPASALIAAMEQVASGNLSIRVADRREPPEGELGDIARSFDRLAASLQKAQEELEASTAERAALASRLRQSERLATLGQIVAEVAHEIGTPLNVVTGRAEFLLPLVEGDLAATHAARTIAEQGQRITRIIQRLLDVARERMPVLEDVEVLETARRTVDFLAPELARSRVTVVLEGDPALRARADPDLLQQVLLNLLTNAIHASPAQGRIVVRAQEKSGRVNLSVSDEGPGVAADQQARLFVPFATTKPAGRGTGLGLSIARSILRQLGGSLRYLEQPGSGGACFEAVLLASEPAAAVTA